MKNSQKLEAYFKNELSSADELELMNELESNAELKQEFEFEKDIVEGLKTYRKEQLIARLNDIKMVSTTQHLVVKVISSIAVVAVVGLGAYFFYYTNNMESELVTDNSNNLEIAPTTVEEQPMIENNISEEIVEEIPTETEEPQEVDVNQKPKAEEAIVIEKSTKTPEVTMPDVVDAFDTELADSNNEEDLSIPANTASAGLNLRSELDVEIKMRRKYNFHYQIVDQKLVLFGNFEDEPFEILEINKDDGGIDLFLYHKENFYAILQGSDEIEPLIELTDPELVQRLQALR